MACQDALVKQVIEEKARRLRDERDAALWGKAAHDAAFRAELEELDAFYAVDERCAWQQRMDYSDHTSLEDKDEVGHA